VDDGISFWFLGNEYCLTWKILSHHLGFSARLPISLELATFLIVMISGV
jgi:hypothetical protein